VELNIEVVNIVLIKMWLHSVFAYNLHTCSGYQMTVNERQNGQSWHRLILQLLKLYIAMLKVFLEWGKFQRVNETTDLIVLGHVEEWCVLPT